VPSCRRVGPDRQGDAQVEWNTYIAVDDADAAACRCAERPGAESRWSPVDAGPGGRCWRRVPIRGGARFRLCKPRRRLGAQLTNAHGSWNFSDLHAGDAAAATGFYAPLFGWEFDDLGFATMIRRPGLR